MLRNCCFATAFITVNFLFVDVCMQLVVWERMAAIRPTGDFPDASEMLAEALKQMDGLLAGHC